MGTTGRLRTSRTAENLENVRQSVRESLGLPFRKKASALNFPKSSVDRRFASPPFQVAVSGGDQKRIVVGSVAMDLETTVALPLSPG
ncbi:hypothetical protein Trydic_g19050 [Trypoxylus dichotomus]